MLVTGATGMVGRALVSNLRASGVPVAAVGRTRKAGMEADHFWELGDQMGPALDGVQTLIHLAARVHIRGAGFSDKEGFDRENAELTLRLAKEAHAYGVRRFVFASSIGVLGSRSERPLGESDARRPHNAYTYSKSLAEEKLEAFSRSSGMQLVILRFPAVVGVGVKGNVDSLLRAVRLQVPLPFSLINNQRQFVTLRNLVDGIVLAAKHDIAAGEIFHLANPERISTLQLCKLIAEELGVKLRCWPLPPAFLNAAFLALGRKSLADGLTGNMLIDTSKISSVLGWEPEQPLQSAIREIISGRG